MNKLFNEIEKDIQNIVNLSKREKGTLVNNMLKLFCEDNDIQIKDLKGSQRLNATFLINRNLQIIKNRIKENEKISINIYLACILLEFNEKIIEGEVKYE